MSDLRLIRGASNSRFGGIHWYEWKPKEEAVVGPPVRDLVLLHPVPLDATVFNVIAPLLAAGRTVVAPEYPGHGRSDALREAPTIGKYAEAMVDMLRARDTHGAADLLGYAAGCLVAGEMALRYPDEIHALVLVDVPYFSASERRQKLREHGDVPGCLAAWSYPCQERFPMVGQACLVVNTQRELLEPAQEAAGALANARFTTIPGEGGLADPSLAEKVSAATLEFLAS